jgi:hypothetical protein
LEGEEFNRLQYQAISRFVTAERSYLTELRAKMTPQQMANDVRFSRAWNDWGHRKREGGLALTPREQVLLLLLIAAVVTLVVVRRRYRRRLREVETDSAAR